MSTSGGENLGRKRQLSLSPSLFPVGWAGYFCFLPQLPLSSALSMALPFKTCSPLPLPHRSVIPNPSPAWTSFSGPVPPCRGVRREWQARSGGWRSPFWSLDHRARLSGLPGPSG